MRTIRCARNSPPSFDRTVTENAETGSIVGNAVQAVPELDDDGEITTTFEYSLEDTISGDDDYFTIDKLLRPDPGG